ncbi:MAG: Ig-like domain-containing protein [Planctomycetota bacterium]|nr:Ig-like domain-containing protein [Planctomycetota bacterium]
MNYLPCTAFALVLASQQAMSQEYRLIDLGVASQQSQAWSVDPSGVAVGVSIGSDAHYHAMIFDDPPVTIPFSTTYAEHTAVARLADGTVYANAYDIGGLVHAAYTWKNGVITPLDLYQVRAVNPSGMIAGTLPVQSRGMTVERTCRSQQSIATPLATSGGQMSQGLGIDTDGRIVGSSSVATDNGSHPCIWVGNAPRDLGTLGGSQGQASSIVSNWIVGSSQGADGIWHTTNWHIDASGTVLYQGDLGSLAAGTSSFALGLSSLGDAVGTSNGRAVRWRDGRISDLNLLIDSGQDWIVEKAWAISDQGVIAATAHRVDDAMPRAVILEPLGAPGSGSPGGGVVRPSAPTLAAMSDLGILSTDRLTSAKDLIFTGSATSRSVVRLLIDGVATSRTATADRSNRYSIKASSAPEGSHEYRITITTPTRQQSALSDPTTVVKDSIIPVTPAAAMLSPADVVITSKPNEVATRSVRPTFLGNVIAGNVVSIVSGGRVVGQGTANEAGNYSVTLTTPLRAGSTASIRVIQSKQSGATSTQSRELRVKVLR